ncbi:phage recombination protein Bet [uncultured Holdemanella sp.]|uniref:phage recombination protein Bet n=1 Tax=uncultured Holdemanella sp. TaxID=1763549 RepID=UPI0025ECA810|nr:phage recombination protein Bet [uncultured Holdemanella sp.]
MLQNNIAKKNDNQLVEFSANGEKVKLSPAIVRNYLVNGNGQITDQEIVYFINLCKSQGLNPFIKDCYLIKYGNTLPAQMVVSKDVFLKRAERNSEFDGLDAGIIVLNGESGELAYRKGAFYLKDREEVVGGWADVFRKNTSHPTHIEVSVEEYAGRTKDGKLNSQWGAKMATMIRKVAITQALRETFPNDFQQMYSEEEMNVDMKLDEAPIQQPIEQAPVQPQTYSQPEEPQPEGVSLV